MEPFRVRPPESDFNFITDLAYVASDSSLTPARPVSFDCEMGIIVPILCDAGGMLESSWSFAVAVIFCFPGLDIEAKVLHATHLQECGDTSAVA